MFTYLFHLLIAPVFFPFQLVHADVWTSPVLSNSGYQYYLVLVDDFTHYVWTFPLHRKNEVLPTLLCFHAYVATQHRIPILALQTNNGKEFDNFALHSFFSTHGIHLCLSCPYTSPQNGKAERILRMLNNCVCTMLIKSRAPPSFWAEALNTVTYLINRRPCKATGTTTPFELLLGVPPTYAHLRVFGCLCFPNLMATTPNKLSPRSTSCAFLGYPADHKGYRCFDLASHKVITSRHMVFDEAQFSFIAIPSPRPSGSSSSAGTSSSGHDVAVVVT
jgi:hypothetical protein